MRVRCGSLLHSALRFCSSIVPGKASWSSARDSCSAGASFCMSTEPTMGCTCMSSDEGSTSSSSSFIASPTKQVRAKLLKYLSSDVLQSNSSMASPIGIFKAFWGNIRMIPGQDLLLKVCCSGACQVNGQITTGGHAYVMDIMELMIWAEHNSSTVVQVWFNPKISQQIQTVGFGNICNNQPRWLLGNCFNQLLACLCPILLDVQGLNYILSFPRQMTILQNNHVAWVQWGLAHERCQNPVLLIHDGQPCNKRLFFTLVHGAARDSTLDTVHCFHHRWATTLHHHIVILNFRSWWQNDLLARWLYGQLLVEVLRCIWNTCRVVTYIIGSEICLLGFSWTGVSFPSAGNSTPTIAEPSCPGYSVAFPVWRIMDLIFWLFWWHFFITRAITLGIIRLMSISSIASFITKIIVDLLGERIAGCKDHDPWLGFLVPSWWLCARLTHTSQGPLPRSQT